LNLVRLFFLVFPKKLNVFALLLALNLLILAIQILKIYLPMWIGRALIEAVQVVVPRFVVRAITERESNAHFIVCAELSLDNSHVTVFFVARYFLLNEIFLEGLFPLSCNFGGSSRWRPCLPTHWNSGGN
jgi:hypothetical protein